MSATAGSASDIASIAVTGGFPGLVSRTYDYVNRGYDLQRDQFLQKLEGTFVRNLAVNGNRVYTLDLGIRSSPPFNVNPPFTALEVYSDPTNPVWLNAAESITDRPSLFSTYGHYLFEVDTGIFPDNRYNPPSRIALYDIQSSPPKLVSFAFTPDLSSGHENNGVIYGAALNSYTGSMAPIYIFDHCCPN